MNADILSKFPGTSEEFFTEAFEFAELNTPTRQALFLATVGHESNFLRSMTEDLKNYKPQRLVEVWPLRFSSNGKKNGKPTFKAQQVAGNAYATAEAVYGGRMGNRAEGFGDGWKYRGRGPGGLTGKKNYIRADTALGLNGLLVNNPDLVATPKYGMLAFATWWQDNKMNRWADKYDEQPVQFTKSQILASARKTVQGGNEGLDKFEALFYLFEKYLQ